ncbi:MAG: quinone-dependent dihydroorotate dehydrogenase [Rickettsiaceae bacterium]|jgi:dihydroorotate dehydrogenase|nr:quinone-dependent dihydroorotate dehydrogenase [Rickettsiaceae bacterium]
MNYSLFKPLIFLLDPEVAHNMAISVLRAGLICRPRVVEYPSLQSKVFGIDFKNPIGMAAGFDKNAAVFSNLFNFGFGFVEVGTVTPKAQAGNEKPRIFRLKEDEAIINRLGFNNFGIDCFLKNIEKRPERNGVLGINIGKNKDTVNAIDDYLLLLRKTYGKSDYITINISSPNTKNLRDLQKADELDLFLKTILEEKIQLQKAGQKNIPILLKIAPDLNLKEQEAIADIALKNQIDGLIIGNTTISRPQNLQSGYKNEIGGLSGKPLFEISNQVLANIYKLTKGRVPIIAAGGVASAADAYHKIGLGASLVQIYSAFIYQGFGLVEEVKRDLDGILKKDGFKNVAEAVGRLL